METLAQKLDGSTENEVNVVFFFDQNFEQAALIAAHSIAKSVRCDRSITIYAFYMGDLAFQQKASLLQTERLRIVGQRINNPFTPNDGIAYDNPAYYLRLAVAELLPKLDKVIYLDVDLLVHRDLSELYDLSLGGCTIGAVPDGTVEALRKGPSVGRTINTTTVAARPYLESFMPAHKTYFNSGVMLIDLAAWRRRECRARALAFVRERYMMLFADQDALNFILHDDVAMLPGCWNEMPTLELSSSREPPGIVHYAAYKPWRSQDRRTQCDDSYWDYVMTTPFGAEMRDKFFASLAYELGELDARSNKIPSRHWGRWRIPLVRLISQMIMHRKVVRRSAR